MAAPLTQREAGALAASLHAALAADLGAPALPNDDGWTLDPAEPWQLGEQNVALLALSKDGVRLSFVVYPSRPDLPAYFRAARFDVGYHSDDYAPEDGEKLFRDHQATIDRVCAWLAAWDARTSPAQA